MFFFIDPEKLTSQQDYQSYGPVSIIKNSDGTLSGVDARNKYNVTSRFQLNDEAKAFACLGGRLIVQQSNENPSLVNLILRPETFNNELPIQIQYFVYRGILKSSLLNDGTNCTIQQYDPNTSNDLIRRMRQDPNITDFSCEQIGYSNQLSNSDRIEDIFLENNLSVHACHYVAEGEWIGTFSNFFEIGFEVIVKSDFNDFNIGFLRAGNHEIDLTSYSGFQRRLKSEEILRFLDPAAFYGMYHTIGVDYFVENNSNNKDTTTENYTLPESESKFLFTKLLSNFFTKNSVYVDIRSERGYSYNFYQNYRVDASNLDNIRIRTESGNIDLLPQQYQTFDWPILILKATHNSGDQNSLKFQLRIDDNLAPILYTRTSLEKDRVGNAAKITSRYFNTLNLIDNGDNPDHTTWTNTLRILFPNTKHGVGQNSNRDYISNYVRLHYFRSKHNPNNLADSVLENIHYYDSAFCSIDIPDLDFNNILGTGSIESSNPIYVREPLHYHEDHPDYDEEYNIEGTGNFELNMINGVYWGDNRVLMYSRIEYVDFQKSKINQRRIIANMTSGKEYLNTYNQQLSSFTSNKEYTLLANDRLRFLCREYDISNNATRTKIPSINFFRSNDLGDSGKNHKENLMLLGLTKGEMNSLKADSQLSDGHQRVIYLEPLDNEPNPQQDNNGNRYFQYGVRLQGFDSNQSSIMVTPQHDGNNIVVYSRDNQFFSSYAFSVNENVNNNIDDNAVNRIEFHIYNDGVIKINDNIDFALRIENDANGTNTSRVFYKYYNSASNIDDLSNIQITDICNLQFLIADKMVFGGNATMPNSNNSTEVINYNATNNIIDGVSAGRVVRENTTRNIIVGPTNINCHSPYGTKRYKQVYSSTGFPLQVFLVKMVTQEGTGNVWNCVNPSTNTRQWLDENEPTYDPYRFVNLDLNIDMRFANTARLYANPILAAAVMGALVRLFALDENAPFVESQGFAYKDSSSYPSKKHVNGEAFDLTYRRDMRNRGTLNITQQRAIDLDGSLINALHFYGFNWFYIGNASTNYMNQLDDYPETHRDRYHNDHIHGQNFTPLLEPR